MKVVFLLTLIFASTFAVNEGELQKGDTRGLGDIAALIKMVNDIAKKIKEILPEPISIENFHLIIPRNKYTSGSVYISDCSVHGVKDFFFETAFFLPPHAKLTLSNVTFNTKYIVDIPILNIDLLSIFGDGEVSVAVTDFDLYIAINILAIFKHKDYVSKIELKIKDIQVNITGILDDETTSQRLTKYLNTEAMKFFNNNVTSLSNMLKDLANKLINKIMDHNKNSNLYADDGRHKTVADMVESFTMPNILPE